MIAKGKSISHGAAMVEYAANRETAQLLAYSKLDIDFEMTFGQEPDNVWEQFKLHAMRHPPIDNSLMRFEISLSKEEQKNWSMNDYHALLADFIDVFDNLKTVKKKDKKGNLKDVNVKPTNLKNSQWIVFYHQNTDEPHLHFLVNRIDEEGNVNDDSLIRNRAMKAAEIINQRRGWKSTLAQHEENIESMKQDIFDVLKQMPVFTWGKFETELKKNDITIEFRTDTKGNVVGYTVKLTDGHSIYKASEISDSLTAKHIEETWKKLHEECSKNSIKAYYLEHGLDTDTLEINKENVRKPFNLSKPSLNSPAQDKSGTPKTVEVYDTSRHFHKIEFGFYKCEFSIEACIEDLISNEIHACVDEEAESVKDSDDDNDIEYHNFLTSQFNFDAAMQMAQMLFIGYLKGATSMSDSIGGGGGCCVGGWSGKRKDDDDADWARRCASMAVRLSKPWHLSKRKGRGIH